MTHPHKLTNILYCESNIDGTIGGSFFSLLYLVSGIDKSKYKPIVVFHHNNALIPKYIQAGIQVIVIPKPQPLVFKKTDNLLLNPIFRLIQKSVNFFKFFLFTGAQYARFIKKHNIEILHLNNSITRNHDWMLGAILAGIKCITHERGINSHYSRMSRYFSKRLDAIVCISNAVRDNFLANGVNLSNLVVIYNGIDPSIVAPTKGKDFIYQKHGISEDQIPIGVIGNIKEWKGQETIIRAMPKIVARFPNVVCLLVGDTAIGDQYYRTRLEKLIDELEMTKHAVFTGYTDNVADYLNLLQIVIHTSEDPEPFGRVLIEAMAMKKPLIGAHAGAVQEIIEEGITGLTFPPKNAEALSDAVLRLLNDPQKAEQMGLAGYQRLCDNFLISANVEKTEHLYEKLLGTESSRIS